jgi:hypothetical protein
LKIAYLGAIVTLVMILCIELHKIVSLYIIIEKNKMAAILFFNHCLKVLLQSTLAFTVRITHIGLWEIIITK